MRALEMATIVLDLADCGTVEQLHDALKRRLSLPAYYGGNLDALWDCLTGWITLPLTVELHGIPEARHAVGEYVDKLLETLRAAETELDGFKVEVR
jgi:ribonuclease inhibitor